MELLSHAPLWADRLTVGFVGAQAKTYRRLSKAAKLWLALAILFDLFALQIITEKQVCHAIILNRVSCFWWNRGGGLRGGDSTRTLFPEKFVFAYASYIYTSIIVSWLNYAKMFGPWKQSKRALYKNCPVNYLAITFNYLMFHSIFFLIILTCVQIFNSCTCVRMCAF